MAQFHRGGNSPAPFDVRLSEQGIVRTDGRLADTVEYFVANTGGAESPLRTRVLVK